MALIDVKNLKKHFRVLTHKRGLFGAARNLFSARGDDVEAVRGVSFEINAGEFVGYIGPNGAGKSTTIKMLTGILVPSSGKIQVNGLVPHRDRKANAAQIGVVFGQRTQLWWDLPPIETFSLLGKIYRVEESRLRARIELFTAMLELESFLNTPVRKLSLGQRMRCDLTAALLHEPKILFLDEPTIGLDVVAKQRIRAFLQKINEEQQTTILLTTHDLDDIERLCERVMVIDHGSIIHDGSISELRRKVENRRRMVVDFRDQVVPEVPYGVDVVESDGLRIEFEFDADQVAATELIRLLGEQGEIADLTISERDIESIIEGIYSGVTG